MKIIKQSASLLEIYLPRLLFRLVGVLFIGVGGLMVLATSISSTLNCYCSQNLQQCTLTNSHLGLYRSATIISGLQKAEIINTTNSNGAIRYKVMLKGYEQQIFLTDYAFDNYSKVKLIIDKINQYLSSCQHTPLALGSFGSIWLQLLLWLFPLAGLCMFFARRVTLSLNKTTNQFIVRKQGLLNRVENYYSLDAIERVYIEESSLNQRKMYRVVFTLNNGTDVPINSYYDGLLAENIKLAKMVCTFLNLQGDFSSWEKKNRFQTYLAGAFLVAGLIMVIYLIFR